jgi:hypothetical protein
MNETDDNDELYKQELAMKIIQIFQACFYIMGLYAENNPENQILVYNKLVKILLNYVHLNLG